jgi:hypothetical protein
MTTVPKKKVQAKIQGIGLPIKWNTPDNIISRYASNFVVQILENECKISFFEINPDFRLGLENKVPTEIQADCVANIIISINKLPVFIDLLQRQYNMIKDIQANSILPTTPTES